MKHSLFVYYIKRQREYCVRCRRPFGRTFSRYCDKDSHIDRFGWPAFRDGAFDCGTDRRARHLCLDCDNVLDYDLDHYQDLVNLGHFSQRELAVRRGDLPALAETGTEPSDPAGSD